MKMKTNHKLYVHVQRSLTILFTSIAGMILVLMSLGYLYMSEREWREKNQLTFLNTSNTIFSNMEHLDMIPFRWLSTVANENNLILAIYDNNTLLSYSETSLSDDKKALAASALDSAAEELGKSNPATSDYISPRKHFTIQSTEGITYDANVARLGSSPYLFTVILHSHNDLTNQLRHQRLQLLIGDAIGLFALFLFTYFFIGKLLTPIRENQRRQTEFIAAASHELRTPLAVILSAISAFRKADAADGNHYLSMIEQEGRQMSTLLEHLLVLARTSDPSYKPAIEPVELDTLLLNTYETFLPLASEQRVPLSISLPETAIPPCPCDAARISQLFGILISNAISHGQGDGGILLSMQYKSPYFFIYVEDHGPGISDQAKPHIFERFYREDRARSRKGHFGLGLCIAKEIVQAHHGRISVSDTPGGGATFTVCLPEKDT